MTAIKSPNRTNVAINRNFIIKVQQPMQKDWTLTTARKVSQYYQNEELKTKHFKQVLERGRQVYLFKIRNRLKIKFHSK